MALEKGYPKLMQSVYMFLVTAEKYLFKSPYKLLKDNDLNETWCFLYHMICLPVLE